MSLPEDHLLLHREHTATLPSSPDLHPTNTFIFSRAERLQSFIKPVEGEEPRRSWGGWQSLAPPLFDLWSSQRRTRALLSNTAGDLQPNISSPSPTARKLFIYLLFEMYYFLSLHHCDFLAWCRNVLPEEVDDVSWQNVHEENGQADVEHDNHADHDGVRALEKTGTRHTQGQCVLCQLMLRWSSWRRTLWCVYNKSESVLMFTLPPAPPVLQRRHCWDWTPQTSVWVLLWVPPLGLVWWSWLWVLLASVGF